MHASTPAELQLTSWIPSLLIAGAVSLASAVAYNRYVLHQRGTDQLPSITRVRDALTFAKDLFIISGIVRWSPCLIPS